MTRRSQSGQVVVLLSLSMVAIIGVAAMAVDASFMYEKRNRLHAAADASARSAALEVQRGNTSADHLLAFVQRSVTFHGFGTGVIQDINCPPTSGPYQGAGSCTTGLYVEVILREDTGTFFANVLGFASMTPRARSVAGSSSSTTCLIALTPTSPGIKLTNSGTISAPDCDVLINATGAGALTTSGDPWLTANGIGMSASSSNGWSKSGSWHLTPSTPTYGLPPATDPLAGHVTPTLSTPCITNQGPGDAYKLTGIQTATLSPGTYCGFALSNAAKLYLNPGVYSIGDDDGIILSGDSEINATGGVTIYNSGGGPLQINNGTRLHLTAPTSGDYEGIAYFQPASNAATLNLTGDGHYDVSGITYLPGAQFRPGNSGHIDGACVVIIAASFESNGAGSALASNCSIFGGNPLKTISLAE